MTYLGGTTRKFAVSLAIGVFLLALSAQAAFAMGSVLVNDSSAANQKAPAIYGSRVVWEDWSGDTSIKTKVVPSGAQETVYSASGKSNLSPAISGNRVVWNRNSEQIYMKDYGAGGAVSTITAAAAFLPGNPAIDGNRVVWQDLRNGGGNPDIYMRTIGGAETGAATGSSSQVAPSIFGANLVWADNYLGSYDIFMSNVAIGGNDVVCSAPGQQMNPSISGYYVAWQDDRDGTRDIYVRNTFNFTPEVKIAGDPETSLSSAILPPDDENPPTTSISVNSIAGIEVGDRLTINTSPGTGYGSEEVVVNSISGTGPYTLGTGALIYGHGQFDSVQGRWDQRNPSIYVSGGNYKVVWQANRKGDWDIYMYDSATGITSAVISLRGSSQELPRIYGDTVVWQDDRSGNFDIYMSVAPPTVTDDGSWTASSTALHARWTYAGTVTEYQYAIGTSAGATDTRDWTSVGTSTEVTATGLGLAHGSTYYFSVKPIDTGVEGDPGTSNGIGVDTQGPTIPGSPTASAGNGTSHVTWTASTDSQSGFDHYVVYRSTDQGGPYSSVGNRTALFFDDSGLTNGTTYWYKISGVDAVSNEGTKSVEVSATPKALAPTVTDDGPTTESTTTLHASWTAVAGATSYDYAIGTTPGGTLTRDWTDAGASTEVTATGLALDSGQTYYISVRAKAGGNVSSQTGTSNGILIDTEGPAAPTGVAVTAGNTTASVRWNAATDPSGIDHYVVYRSDDGGSTYPNIFTTTNLSYPDSGLTNGNVYFYKVSAVDGLGNEGAASTEVSVTPTESETTLTAQASTSSLACGGSLTLSGDLMSIASSPTPIEANDIQVEHRLPGLGWQAIATTVTSDALGHYNHAFEPTSNAAYRVVWLGDGLHNGALSSEVSVTVRAVVTLRRSSSLVVSSRTYARWGTLYRRYLYLYRRYGSLTYYRLMVRYRTYRSRYYGRRSVVFSGTIAPSRGYKLLWIRYKSGSIWRNLISTGAAGTAYSKRWWPSSPGRFYVRTYFPADANNAAAYSNYVTVVVW